MISGSVVWLSGWWFAYTGAEARSKCMPKVVMLHKQGWPIWLLHMVVGCGCRPVGRAPEHEGEGWPISANPCISMTVCICTEPCAELCNMVVAAISWAKDTAVKAYAQGGRIRAVGDPRQL
jgi:hypothetical protein